MPVKKSYQEIKKTKAEIKKKLVTEPEQPVSKMFEEEFYPGKQPKSDDFAAGDYNFSIKSKGFIEPSNYEFISPLSKPGSYHSSKDEHQIDHAFYESLKGMTPEEQSKEMIKKGKEWANKAWNESLAKHGQSEVKKNEVEADTTDKIEEDYEYDDEEGGSYKSIFDGLINEVAQVKEQASTLDQMVEGTSEESEVASLVSEAKAITEATLEKISGQLGSNEGGWYQDQESQKKYYIKFYKNPDQARVEFVANAIYKKLGIKSIDSQIFEMDGKVAIASAEVPGAQAASREEQKQSTDVRDGFVADAYLANWDVVGLVYDNIVKSGDEMYRIDNGGSLIYRAQGGLKNFDADHIPELSTMLNPNFSAGQVFGEISETEMKAQAQALADKLSNRAIEAIIKDSGLTEENAATIEAGLKGRRAYLIEKFNLKTREKEAEISRARIGKALQKIEQSPDVLNGELRKRTCILADADNIENNQIDIIDARDREMININFKLTRAKFELILAKLTGLAQMAEINEGRPTQSPYKITESWLEYKSCGVSGSSFSTFPLSRAFDIDYKGIKIKISKTNPRESESRSSIGLVNIEVPTNVKLEEDWSITLNNIMSELLEVNDGLVEPNQEAEKEYKINRYKWHHKLEELSVADQGAAEKLKRQEVFPNYYTMVQEGKHKEYQKESPYAVYHGLNSVSTLGKILKCGLMSSHERYKRGFFYNGLSTARDFDTGGADSVFVRTATETAAKRRDWRIKGESGASIILNPRIFDRTDWYSYKGDEYGRTTRGVFDNRQTPRELFDNQNNAEVEVQNNEQMLRCGIPSSEFIGILCGSESCYRDVMEVLNNNGITEINGKPIEKFVTRGEYATAALAVTKNLMEEEYARTNVATVAKRMAEQAEKKAAKLAAKQAIKKPTKKALKKAEKEAKVKPIQKERTLMDKLYGQLFGKKD